MWHGLRCLLQGPWLLLGVFTASFRRIAQRCLDIELLGKSGLQTAASLLGLSPVFRSGKQGSHPSAKGVQAVALSAFGKRLSPLKLSIGLLQEKSASKRATNRELPFCGVSLAL